MPIWLIQILVGIVFSVAGQLLSSINKQDQKQVSGVRGTLQSGGDLSPRFIIGRYGTGGQLRYAGTWGNAGDVPNAYYSKVIEVSCLPIRGFSGFFVNGERVTLAGTKTGNLGYAVLEYRVGGKDHLWINPYTGSQTAPDPLMLAQFGSDADKPYAGMVGRGCGYFVATALVNRELFSGFPEYLAEVDGIALTDPRGGTAQHDNPIVAAYTLLRGLTYGGEWVYGPQGYSANNFRSANLVSEANKCDALRAGSSEKRYRVGLDIALDEEPHAVLGELLKACAGRWADLGGVYRFLVGSPGAAVVAVTDEDFVITDQQTLDPFPGLEDLHNAMSATYPEPGEAWEMKEAPPRYRADLEAADDGRRLVFATQFKAVPWAVQVQDLMRTTIEDARRFRRHTQTMPPEFWEYEPLDVVAWTSSRNGYVAEEFLITVMDDLPNANQFVGWQEMDPSDYDWSSDFELPFEVSPLIIARPAPQTVSGPSVEPVPGELAFDAFWSAPSVAVDVDFVRITYRLPDDDETRVTVPVPKPDLLLGSARVPVALSLANTAIEVQLEYISWSGRPMVASAWMPVTIADVRIGWEDMTAELRETLEGVQEFMDEEVPVIRDELEEMGDDLDALAGAPVFAYGDAYAVNDLVRYSGGIYRATVANSDVLPTDVTKWVQVGEYNSVAGTVIGFTARFENVETTAENTANSVIQTTRDTRRIQNALLAAAMLNAEQGQNQVLENTDQLAASASVSETVRTEVSRIDGTTTALAEQINVVQAQVEEDVAQAISAVTTQVQDVDGRVTAEAARVDQLRAVIGDSAAEIVMKGTVMNGPGGPNSRWAVRLQTSNNGAVVATGMLFVDIIGGEATIGFQANKTVFYTSDGTAIALLTDDKKLRSANGAYEVNMVTGDVTMTRGEIRSSDGKFLISPSLKRMSISS